MGETKKKKKKKGRKILLILLILLLIFLFWPVDEDYTSEDKNYDTTEMGQALSGSGGENRNKLEEYFGNDIIREQYVQHKGNGEDRVTILMYMNGSDLESEAGEATTDLSEMVTGAGVSDKVNILVQTMGTKNWDSKYGISSKRTERYKLDGNGLTLLDENLSQLDCTKASTLSDFISWGAKNYPADRYILLFWDHGGGAVYGFGYDEWVKDEEATLTIDEMQSAFKDAGIFFDFIGMDCCIMSSLEVCCAFYDFCDYTILSEDFESSLGWSYENWIRQIYNNTSIDTIELGKIICDDMVLANTSNYEEGDNSIMALVDESMIKLLYSSWKEFAFQAQEELTSKNYSRAVKPKKNGRTPVIFTSKAPERNRFGYFYNWLTDSEDYSLEDYSEVDIMSAASSINSNVSEQLKTTISNTLVHVAYSEGDSHLTGLSVYLPYGDSEGYRSMKTIFANIGLDQDYIDWLEQFVYAEGNNDYYDYQDWDNSWEGWDYYDDNYWDCYDDDNYSYDDYDEFDAFWDWLFEDDNCDDYGFADWDYYDYY